MAKSELAKVYEDYLRLKTKIAEREKIIKEKQKKESKKSLSLKLPQQ